MKDALFTILSTDTGLGQLVGDRIYPLLIPQRAWKDQKIPPCLVTAQVGKATQQTYCGVAGTRASRFQIDSYAMTYEGAAAVAEAVESLLQDYRGTVDGVVIKNITLESEFDLTDPEPGLFRVQQTWAIWHTSE